MNCVQTLTDLGTEMGPSICHATVCTSNNRIWSRGTAQAGLGLSPRANHMGLFSDHFGFSFIIIIHWCSTLIYHRPTSQHVITTSVFGLDPDTAASW